MRLQPSVMSVGLGAGIMYLLDPQHGVRRRAQVRERAAGLRSTAGEAAHGLRERSRGLGKLATRLRQPTEGTAASRATGDLPGDGTAGTFQGASESEIGRATSARAVAGIVGGSLLVLGAGLLLRSLRQRAGANGSSRTLGSLPRLHRAVASQDGDPGHDPAAAGLVDGDHEVLVHGSHGAGHDGALSHF
jgi:hypothetical protein